MIPYNELEAIATRLGWPQLRPLQEKALKSLAQGKDTLLIAPTGSGKTLPYTVMADYLQNLVVVISPLISLMQDQVKRANAIGVSAVAIHSLMTPTQQREAWVDVKEGKIRLLFLSPERICNESSLIGLQYLNPIMLVIDEVHSIAWGKSEFRPQYNRLGEIREKLGYPLTLACTATATPHMQGEIAASLHFSDYAVHVGGFDRSNLFLSVKHLGSEYEAEDELSKHIRNHKDGSIIVYFATVKKLKEKKEIIKSLLPIYTYHGQQKKSERNDALEKLTSGKECCIFATNSLGMGVDAPTIRSVLHMGLPGSLEAYYQEAGRAGRDGNPALCEILNYPGAGNVRKWFIDQAEEHIKPEMRNQLNEMYRYLNPPSGCHREHILKYFGDPSPVKLDPNLCCSGCSE